MCSHNFTKKAWQRSRNSKESSTGCDKKIMGRLQCRSSYKGSKREDLHRKQAEISFAHLLAKSLSRVFAVLVFIVDLRAITTNSRQLLSRCKDDTWWSGATFLKR